MANIIIEASAGSGKTFQLSNRYLDIVFRDKPIETILASTFTRKAAREILDRILQRLAEAALDPKKCKELEKFVPLPSGVDSADVKATSKTLQKILAGMARNLYRLRISTLDSFFNKIASAFSLELGLPPGWTIIDETDFKQNIIEAVRTVLNDSDHNGARDLMNMLQKGEQDRNVTRELIDLASKLLPIVRETKPEVWENKILERKGLDESEFNTAIKQFEHAELPKGKTGKPNGHFVNARESLCTSVMRNDWIKFFKSALIQNSISSKPEYRNIPLEGDLLESARKLHEHAQAVLIGKLVGQTRATRRLLDLIVEAYDEILFQERGFRFEDITDRINRTDFQPRFEALIHRMDARTDHLLLDEFQDTSMPQWGILRGFALKAAGSPTGSFFCVGDPKQAIYGWRGGVAEIFKTIEKEIPNAEPLPLHKSYRSSPVVIDTVNMIFRSIDENPALENYRDAAVKWGKQFIEHDTAKTHENCPGYCVLEVAPTAEFTEDDKYNEYDGDDDNSDDYSEGANVDKDKVFTDYTVRRIAELHRSKSNASIGVLVAGNKKIGPLIAGLKRFGIEASEEGGNPLTDSAAVRYVLSALTLFDHPGDRVARFHLATGPLAETLQLRSHDDDRAAAECSLRWRRKLLAQGYGDVVRELAETLAPSCNQREFQRLEKLEELAYRFEDSMHGKSPGVRTERFVDMVRSTKIKSPTASPIQIMTIHASKGLEFDIVVLPELDTPLVKQTPMLIVDRETPDSDVNFVLRYVTKEVQNLLPEKYKKAFEKRIQAEVEERLSVLYVAVTRAVNELVMIVKPPAPNAGTIPRTFTGILRNVPEFVKQSNAAEIIERKDGSKILFQWGTPDWYSNDTEPPQKPEPEFLDFALADPPAAPTRNLVRITPSSMELEFSVAKTKGQLPEKTPGQAPEYRLNRERALLWGTAMHACFEYGLADNPWLDQARPNEKSLLEVVEFAVMGKPGEIDAQKVVERFFEICEMPDIRKTLRLETYEKGKSGTAADRKANLVSPNWTVENERRFMVRTETNKLLVGSVDRLVVLRDGNKIIGLDVIDYKTDRPTSGQSVEDFLKERREIYAPQLSAYREGMSRLFQIDIQKITTRILFVEQGKIVEIV